MSKQSEAKKNQNYTPKAKPRTCQNCTAFTFDRVQTQPPTQWNEAGWWEDKNLRCEIGGFAVKKMASCDMFVMKPGD